MHRILLHLHVVHYTHHLLASIHARPPLTPVLNLDNLLPVLKRTIHCSTEQINYTLQELLDIQSAVNQLEASASPRQLIN